MRYILTILLVFIFFESNSQKLVLDDHISVIKKIFDIEEYRKDIKQFSHSELSVLNRNLNKNNVNYLIYIPKYYWNNNEKSISVVEYNGQNLIFLDEEDLFFFGLKSFSLNTCFVMLKSKNKFTYTFLLLSNSPKEKPMTYYDAYLKLDKNEWKVIEINENKNYDSKTTLKYKDCKIDKTKKTKKLKSNPLHGDWKYIINNHYLEAYFTVDKLIIYGEDFRKEEYNFKLLNDSMYIINAKDSPDTLYRKFKTVSKKEILIFDNNNPEKIKYSLTKIKNEGFRLSKVRYWTFKIGFQTVYSNDEEKYKKGLLRRKNSFK